MGSARHDEKSARRRSLRRVLLTAAVLVVILGVVVGGLAAMQRRLVYFPDTSAVPPAGSALPGGRDVTLRTSDGLDLGAWFAPPTTDRGLDLAVLLAPGNGGNRAGRVGLAALLRQQGLAVLLMDYRGYGGNPGEPSEEGLARDADAAVAALGDLGYPPEQVVYLGESLGTGVVSALAARTPPAAMVLRSPFTDLAEVGALHYPWLPVRLLLRDRFPVVEHVRRSDVPLVVVYGTEDSVVPSALSTQVAEQAPGLVDVVALTGVDHNDPEMFGDPVVAAVLRLTEAVR